MPEYVSVTLFGGGVGVGLGGGVGVGVGIGLEAGWAIVYSILARISDLFYTILEHNSSYMTKWENVS